MPDPVRASSHAAEPKADSSIKVAVDLMTVGRRLVRQEVAVALGLFGAMVTAATAFKKGRLVVEFDNGVQLTVAADPQFEAWSVTGPYEVRVVCMPGGELAIWR